MEDSMRADQDIRRDVERELEWEPSIDAGGIGVAVKDGIVTLSGFVHAFVEKFDAERAAKRVVGVVGLANDVEVRPRDQRTDGEVAHAAVEALKTHTSIPEGKVRPVVKNGIVTLEGEVEWQFQRNAALTVVRGLRGVKYVTDQIHLKPTARSSPPEIKTKIEDALKRSAQVDARKITVAMTGGTVTLTGSVRSYWEREEAETAAWAAPGVTRVDNQIKVEYVYGYDYE
jgi:osmotically-inducible protein OsmY